MRKSTNFQINVQSSSGEPHRAPNPAGSRVRRADAAALALSVDVRAAEPLHVQLGRQLRAMILSGRIARGARLPSSRALALDLGVSRSTVVLALEQLASEGYLVGRRGSGLYVPEALPEQALQVEARPAPSRSRRALIEPAPEPARPFQIGATDASLFAYQKWARLLYRTWRAPEAKLVSASHPFGWRELREAISGHLAEWRGLVCDPAQILVTSGTADSVEIIAQCAFRQGEVVCVEDPGYPTLRYALSRYGIATEAVPVDEDGICSARVARHRFARGAIVTPSRQFPLGGTLPLARRLELLEWAAASGGTIVEDDFDSEYRYEGAPLPALSSLDSAGRTIYLGSFSKVLSPTLRLGFIVLPERLVAPVHDHIRRRGATASLVAQPAVAALIASGEYATHIRRTRRIYARRMAALVAEAERYRDLLDVRPTAAGMHVVADLAPALAGRADDRAVAHRAQAAGISVAPLADYYAGRARRQALLLGFAGFEEEMLQHALRRLAGVLAKCMR